MSSPLRSPSIEAVKTLPPDYGAVASPATDRPPAYTALAGPHERVVDGGEWGWPRRTWLPVRSRAAQLPLPPHPLRHRVQGLVTALPKVVLTPVAGAMVGLLSPTYGLYKTNLLELARPVRGAVDLGYNLLLATALGCTFLPVATAVGAAAGLVGGACVGVMSAVQNKSPLDFVDFS